MRRRLGAVTFCVLCAHSQRSLGYRPFDGTDAEVANVHEIELEVGPLEYVHAPASPVLVAPALIVNYGFANGFELVIEGRHEVQLSSRPIGSQSRIVNSALSVKEVLREGCLQGNSGFSIANEWSLLLPDTGTNQHFGAETTTIFSERWQTITLHLNVYNELSPERHYLGSIGPILEGPYSLRIRPVVELIGGREFGSSRLNQGLFGSALFGAIGRVGEVLSLDFALRYARFAGTREAALRAGFTWSFDGGVSYP